MFRILGVIGFAALAGCGAESAQDDPRPVGDVISLGDIVTDEAGNCFAQQDSRTQMVVSREPVEGTGTLAVTLPGLLRPQPIDTGPGPQFEVVCPQILSSRTVETLQRALIVRRAYAGPVSGSYDTMTATAVQRYQRESGIDSRLLAVSVAQDLGVIAVRRQPPPLPPDLSEANEMAAVVRPPF